ncbi:uncharacterized protein LOC129894753 [Solanum dulcamara]|uniref:uncharacterized protein LOC129894753 n=1 Tax=Solanum dulcamara TaxID=45834 RepID=UPI0024863E9D|nr:uncharacterized protein LOC129894753 [Solanum dulcamara]
MDLDLYLVDNYMAMDSQLGMDIARVQVYAQGVEERHKRCQPDRGFDRAQPKKARSIGYSGEFQSGRYSRAGQSSKASGTKVNQSSQQSRSLAPQCPHCNRLHFGEYRRSVGSCFCYGRQGHISRESPFKGTLGGAAQPTGSVVGSSSSVAMRSIGWGIQIPAGHGRGRGGVSSYGGPSNHIYALASR